MKRIVISSIAVIAVLAAATSVLWSHSLSRNSTGTISPHEMHAKIGADKLPVQQFEDRSVVFSTPAKE
jgi:hypothetical protein